MNDEGRSGRWAVDGSKPEADSLEAALWGAYDEGRADEREAIKADILARIDGTPFSRRGPILDLLVLLQLSKEAA